jgi:hypothetical protein
VPLWTSEAGAHTRQRDRSRAPGPAKNWIPFVPLQIPDCPAGWNGDTPEKVFLKTLWPGMRFYYRWTDRFDVWVWPTSPCIHAARSNRIRELIWVVHSLLLPTIELDSPRPDLGT